MSLYKTTTSKHSQQDEAGIVGLYEQEVLSWLIFLPVLPCGKWIHG